MVDWLIDHWHPSSQTLLHPVDLHCACHPAGDVTHPARSGSIWTGHEQQQCTGGQEDCGRSTGGTSGATQCMDRTQTSEYTHTDIHNYTEWLNRMNETMFVDDKLIVIGVYARKYIEKVFVTAQQSLTL